MECWTCGKHGHIARYCPLRATSQIEKEEAVRNVIRIVNQQSGIQAKFETEGGEVVSETTCQKPSAGGESKSNSTTTVAIKSINGPAEGMDLRDFLHEINLK